MGISLDEGFAKLPHVKLPAIGDWVSGHIIDMERTKIKQKNTLIVTLMAKDSSAGALAKLGPDEQPIEPGEEVQIFVDGQTYHWWIEAKRNHPSLEVGDVLRWKFECTRPNDNPAHSEYRDRKFAFRKPNEDEKSLVVACESAHRDRRAQQGSADEFAGTNADPSRQVDASDKF